MAQVVLLVGLLIGVQLVSSWWPIAIIAVCYAIVMNSAYCMLHEAEHGLMHKSRWVNEIAGAILALFFPAPFHLLRQGHIGHHQRNRSDDEAFDFYFDGESPTWKRLQFYGIAGGAFYVVVVIGGLLSLLWPRSIMRRRQRPDGLDRPTAALIESLNPRFMRWIRLEALAVIGLHVALPLVLGASMWRHLALLMAFGLLWSGTQYLHHFGTVRDVRWGARNLRTWRWLDVLWLNHNLHLNHHLHPTVSWIYLPRLTPTDAERPRMLPTYIGTLRGPSYTDEHVENHHAGRIIR